LSIGCDETSVTNYHYLLRNNPEKRSSVLLGVGSLEPRETLAVDTKACLLRHTLHVRVHKHCPPSTTPRVFCGGRLWPTKHASHLNELQNLSNVTPGWLKLRTDSRLFLRSCRANFDMIYINVYFLFPPLRTETLAHPSSKRRLSNQSLL
jgi:hypothetical protein